MNQNESPHSTYFMCRMGGWVFNASLFPPYAEFHISCQIKAVQDMTATSTDTGQTKGFTLLNQNYL